MIKGTITCGCGQFFGFETITEIINCPRCDKEFISSEHGVLEEQPIEEEVYAT